MGMKNTTRGEIVKVEGGHIVRSTGRKDRHSKVYTAKGPRDRRVRLSAHTAIQFYDVQDRLGYDRPSKAVDWLIDKARTAIDKLAELPPLDLIDENETTTTTATTEPTKMTLSDDPDNMSLHGFHTNSMSFGNTMVGNYSSGRQDLCLSLESFQDHGNKSHGPSDALFSTSAPMEFDADIGSFQRMVPWNGVGDFNSAFVSHREPLQSSYLHSVRAWDDLQNGSSQHHKTPEFNLFSISGDRFGSQGFSGFCIPPRIHGDEQHNVDSNSPNSHH